MNEIPVIMYLGLCAVTLLFMILSFIIRDNIQSILYAFISMVLAYISSMMILNGTVIMDYVTGAVPITNTAISYFWTFIALIMAVLMIIYIIVEIDERLLSTNGDNSEVFNE